MNIFRYCNKRAVNLVIVKYVRQQEWILAIIGILEKEIERLNRLFERNEKPNKININSTFYEFIYLYITDYMY